MVTGRIAYAVNTSHQEKFVLLRIPKGEDPKPAREIHIAYSILQLACAGNDSNHSNTFYSSMLRLSHVFECQFLQIELLERGSDWGRVAPIDMSFVMH